MFATIAHGKWGGGGGGVGVCKNTEFALKLTEKEKKFLAPSGNLTHISTATAFSVL